MKLNLYISHSWFSLNRYIIEFINNECMDTVSIFYIPAELNHKISFDLLKLLASKRKSQVYVITYKEFYYESRGTFENNSTTKKIDFAQYDEIRLHFDISNEPKTNNLGGTVVAHYFIRLGYLFREKMRVNIWDAEVHSIISRKRKPKWAGQINVKNSELIYDFTKFTEGGLYALGEHFNSTFHLVRPEISDPWYTTRNGVLSRLSLDCKFSKQSFMLYLATLGMTGKVFTDIKNIKKTILIKGPFSFFRMRTPHTQSPGVENSIDYSLALSEVKDRLSECGDITVLSGGNDNLKSLHDFTGALEGNNNYSQLTPEGLHFLNATPDNIICFAGLYSYLYPQEKLQFVLANESPECQSSYWISADDFGCDVYYLNETKHLYPMANNKIVCETPEPLGDSLYAMACLKTIKDIEDKPIVVLGRKFCGESPFQYSPYASLFIDKNKASHLDFAIQYMAKENGEYYHLLPNLFNSEPGHIIDNTLKKYSFPVNSEHLSVSWYTPTEHKAQGSKCQSERTVLLHANNDALNRSWLRSEWKRLAELFLKDGWKVLLIGATSSSITKSAMHDIDVPGVKNLVNKLSISETQKLMSESQLLVSCDSGPIALAGTTNIAIAGLYSIVKGDRRIPYRYGQKGWNSLVLDLNCEYENCFDLIRNPQFIRKLSGTIVHKDYVAWPLNRACIKKALGGDAYQCLTSLSASEVFNSIIKAFSDGRLR